MILDYPRVQAITMMLHMEEEQKKTRRRSEEDEAHSQGTQEDSGSYKRQELL